MGFRYQLFAAGASWIWIRPIWLPLAEETVFCYLKSEFSLNLKLKYQQFNVK
jgi:hypothetical protein